MYIKIASMKILKSNAIIYKNGLSKFKYINLCKYNFMYFSSVQQLNAYWMFAFNLTHA